MDDIFLVIYLGVCVFIFFIFFWFFFMVFVLVDVVRIWCMCYGGLEWFLFVGVIWCVGNWWGWVWGFCEFVRGI